jgi:hypothetical protein
VVESEFTPRITQCYSANSYYTVQQLEAMKLWDKLGAKAANLNYCK